MNYFRNRNEKFRSPFKEIIISTHAHASSASLAAPPTILMICAALLLSSGASAFSLAGPRFGSTTTSVRGARTGGISNSVVVLGGSGATGSEVVLQALERGEEVVTLVRDTSKLKSPRTAAGFTEGAAFNSDKLTVVQGSVTNKADVDKLFAAGGVTGVVVALGGKTADVGATMLQDGTANTVAAMKANGVSKISVVTTIGAGDSMDQAPWAFRLLMMTVMSSIMADKNKQEE